MSPDGAKAPLPSPAPYYVSEYVPGERVVLERNQYYKGPRPQHVDRFTVDIGADPATVFNQVLSGEKDYALGPPQYLAPLARDVGRRYGVNRSQFFVVPAAGGAVVHAQHEPTTVQRERQAAAGRSTSRSTAERSRASSGRTRAR